MSGHLLSGLTRDGPVALDRHLAHARGAPGHGRRA